MNHRGVLRETRGDADASHDTCSHERKSRVWRFIALSAIAVMVLGAVFMVLYEPEEPERTVGPVTVTGGLVCDEIEVDEEGVRYVGEGTAVWHYVDTTLPYLEKVNGQYQERGIKVFSGNDPTIPVGKYKVRLMVDGNDFCYGRLTVDGPITKTYEWNYITDEGSHHIRFDYGYELSDYLHYRGMNTARHASNVDSNSRFVAVDDCTEDLCRCLREAYLEEFGQDAASKPQFYADYLLSFVQCCFTYPDKTSQVGDGYAYDPFGGSADLTLTGKDEYWAYPMETIHMGMGDCEDTSILMSAIFSQSGYDSALVVIPNHMLVGVELMRFDMRENHPIGTDLACKKVEGHAPNLYFCETTYDIYSPVGYIGLSEREAVMSVQKVTMVPAAD